MNGQLIVFSYFCRKYAALGKMEASFLCSRLRYFAENMLHSAKWKQAFFTLVDAFVDN